ncbi:MAG: histidinol-phosphate transaminase [Ferruginibacter sp.]|nr:histidinol-phosphate transaminase [Ferruginibacter sp.]
MQSKDIYTYVRPNIISLKPYSSARDEFKGKEGIFLDANENPFGQLNRYPDPYQTELKQSLSKIKNVPTENIFVGNGSDEVIDIAYRIFCESGKDAVITCPPTYGMYEVSANINNIPIINIPLTKDFELDVDKILSTKAKIVFVCSPNNPTGNSLKNIEYIIQHFDGIVFVDEAYIDFSSRESLIEKINEYPNLIVSQTFSKAWGMAAVRVGTAYASIEIISLYNKVKPPYNVSLLNQQAVIDAMKNIESFQKNTALILSQRESLQKELSALTIVKKIYPSDANFLLVEVTDADGIYKTLANKKIVTRNRNSVVKNTIRITVGTAEENIELIDAMKKL